MFASSWTLGLEAHSRCKKCHFILPFNGPVASVSCAKCGERRVLDRAIWDDVLQMPASAGRVMHENTTKKFQVGIDSDALVMQVTREAPRCRACKREFDPRNAGDACAGCGASLSKLDAPDYMQKTQRTLARTFLGASEGATSETAERWYLWFDVDPKQVTADRKRAAAAVKRVEAKLPKLAPWGAPTRTEPVVEEHDEAPMIPGSGYRDPPRRAIVSDVPKATDGETAMISRNLAVFLIVLAAAIAFLLGRSL